MCISHIINVIEVRDDIKKSHLDVAQSVTMKSMVLAKSLTQRSKSVELVAVHHREETTQIPQEFLKAESILKYAWEFSAMLREQNIKRRFVRIYDILKNGVIAKNSDYYIYTNTDIGLQPNFYDRIFDLLCEGYDGLAINREDVSKEIDGHVLAEKDIHKIWGLPGKRHMGVDCVVFASHLFPKMEFGSVFVGAPPVGAVLLSQVRRNAKKFKWIKNERLTFHLGEDLAWMSESAKIYHIANKIEAKGLRDDVFRETLLSRCLSIFQN